MLKNWVITGYFISPTCHNKVGKSIGLTNDHPYTSVGVSSFKPTGQKYICWRSWQLYQGFVWNIHTYSEQIYVYKSTIISTYIQTYQIFTPIYRTRSCNKLKVQIYHKFAVRFEEESFLNIFIMSVDKICLQIMKEHRSIQRLEECMEILIKQPFWKYSRKIQKILAT